MKELQGVLGDGKIGIFESPTGTGKSLSLICGSMHWLRKVETKLLPESVKPLVGSSELSKILCTEKKDESVARLEATMPPWIKERAKLLEERKLKRDEEEREKVIINHRKRLKRIRETESETLSSLSPHKKAKFSVASKKSQSKTKEKEVNIEKNENDERFIVSEYDTDDESNSKKKNLNDDNLNISNTSDLMFDDQSIESEQKLKIRKIYYCSRTHSQLTQFISEVKSTVYSEDCKLVNLGSRKNLCINQNVNRDTVSLHQINDKCLDMMKATKVDRTELITSSCTYFAPHLSQLFVDHVHSKIRDLEDLTSLGNSLNACPYYGSRSALHSAELVILPYQMLLHKNTRESLGIDLKGNVVIVDEAHNLIDTITQIYSIQLTATQISQSHAQLSQYREKYQSRLHPKNKQYIDKIIFILSELLKFLKIDYTIYQGNGTQILTLNEFLFKTKIDNMNLFKIKKYLEDSDIIRKINGFSNDYNVEIKTHHYHDKQTRAYQQKATTPEVEKDNPDYLTIELSSSEYHKHRPALGTVSAFFQALSNDSNDGVIKVERNQNLKNSSISFILLNPESYFLEIAQEARAVVLAGGTMQPIDHLTKQLFGKAPEWEERVKTFQCGHVIPPSNLHVVIFGSGPCEREFKFDWENRFNKDMITELGNLVINVCNTVPDGVILFFSSYSYQSHVHNLWESSGIIERITKKKKIFMESQNSSSIEVTLSEYAAHINQNTGGALISCVIGGKMSEGINFKDKLGRCVVVVGMPYPNKNDPLMQQKIKYLQSKRGISESHYLENLCMNAVNQSIGRCIRHSKDFACILLVDSRYSRPQIISSLPQWIGQNVTQPKKFGLGYSGIVKFFKAKQNETQQ
uniref:Helicase ATP-binding domain-containing protein n=1 Tax=Arcella intermedia TaxID=1963864 RepID=A0A6B2KXE1_9EUKA